MSALKELQNPNYYSMQKSSAWIFVDDADVWITKGESGLSITVWQRDISMDPVESIHITWDKIKGDQQ